MNDDRAVAPWILGPSSTLTLCLFVLALVLGVAWSIWRWSKFNRRRAARVGCIVVCQLLLVASIGLVINRAEGIATTWSALFGSESGLDAQVAIDRPGAIKRSETFNPANLWDLAPAQSAADRADAKRSKEILVKLSGAQTGYDLPAKIYLPGSYFDPTQANRKYPVIELLAGYPGSYLSWVNGLRIGKTMDSLIASGAMPAAIVIVPSQNPHPPRDSECVNSTSLKDSHAETYLADDVPGYLKSNYRVGDDRVDWVIGGYSTGGFCATNIAIQRPSEYGAAISLSGNYMATEDGLTGKLYGSQSQKRANSPRVMVAKAGGPPIAFFLSAARDSVDDSAELTKFAPVIPQRDPLRVVVTATGEHTPSLWRATSRMALPWVAGVLKSEQP